MPFPLPNESGCSLSPRIEILRLQSSVRAHYLLQCFAPRFWHSSRHFCSKLVFMVYATKNRTSNDSQRRWQPVTMGVQRHWE
jgi:hypothetical protein